ncbi:serine/threonine-protein kinase [Actinomadura gamaensis]|uniref:Protein kinase n=1 Tax=Actinomadura gamaensis TaxID=1763541 RepID=A0ABV9U0K4_9ACTN
MEPLRDTDPRRAGRYRLAARLGGGGMGEVYLGASPGGMTVAVKIVRAHLLQGDPSFRARFAREVAAARSVGGFYTAQVVDADTDAEQPWLATAYIPGPSLYDAVRARREPLPEHAVRVLGAGLAEGLAAIHGCGVVHRDLTPRNIILADGGPRIIDFGIARALDSAPNPASGVFGTPEYMSPEHAKGRATGPSSDVFSLGSVLTFAATGRSPFAAESPLAALHRVIDDAPDLHDVPSRLVSVIAACLAKSPDTRPDVEDVLERLASPAEAVTEWLPQDVMDMVTGYRTRSRNALHRTRRTVEQTDPPLAAKPDSVDGPAEPGAPRPTGEPMSAPIPRVIPPKPDTALWTPPANQSAAQNQASSTAAKTRLTATHGPQPTPAVPGRRPANKLKRTLSSIFAPAKPAAGRSSSPKPSGPAQSGRATSAWTSSWSRSPVHRTNFVRRTSFVMGPALMAALAIGWVILHFYVGGARQARIGDCLYLWNSRVWNKEPCKHPMIGEPAFKVVGRRTTDPANPVPIDPPCAPDDREVHFLTSKKQAGVTLCLRPLVEN